MKKSTLYGIIWSGWLGYWLATLGASLFTWQFWVIFIPIVIFTNLETQAKMDDE
jgi:hypothetical protein